MKKIALGINILDLWAKHRYTPVFESHAKTLTADSKDKRIKNEQK